ncbi:hypothetical protein ACWDVV_38140, partial [Streptomyces tendae]
MSKSSTLWTSSGSASRGAGTAATASSATGGAATVSCAGASGGTIIHGTADEVRSGLDDLQKRTGADELMLTANAH